MDLNLTTRSDRSGSRRSSDSDHLSYIVLHLARQMEDGARCLPLSCGVSECSGTNNVIVEEYGLGSDSPPGLSAAVGNTIT